MKPGILKRNAIESARATNAQSSRSDAAEPCSKRVRLVEDAGVPRAIEVTCSCGETMLIEIAYSKTDAAERAP